MNASELLNADMTTVGRWLAEGWRWWVDELSAMFGGVGRRTAARQARVEADGTLSWWRDGAPTRAPGRGARADVVLLPEAGLRRTLTLPQLSRADLNRLLSSDLDRLTPFALEAVWFDAADVGPAAEGTRRSIALAVVPRETAADALARAAAAGVEPARLRLGDPAGPGGAGHDFLPAIRRAEGGSAASRRRRLAWAAAGLLLTANLAALIGRDMAATAELRRAAEAQRPTVTLALALRRRVDGEEARRAALLARRAEREPLRLLEAVTQALPPPQWVQRLEWNGRTVRLVGFGRSDFDMAAALRGSPLLTAPRSLATETPPSSGRGEPFDVTAELERRAPTPPPTGAPGR